MSVNHMTVESMSVMAKTPLELPDGRMVLAGLTIDEKGQIHISFADPDLAARILSEALHNRIIDFNLGFRAARPAEQTQQKEGDAYRRELYERLYLGGDVWVYECHQCYALYSCEARVKMHLKREHDIDVRG